MQRGISFARCYRKRPGKACAMKDFCSQYVHDESGATAIEYGLIISGITLAILGAIQTLSTNVQTVLFDVIAAAASP
jgi:pilus assembly protein Flp/PilA